MGRGIAYYNNSQFLKAEEEFTKARELCQTEKVLEYLAWIKGYEFNLDSQAIELCRQVLSMNPDNVHALFIQTVCISNKPDRNKELKEFIGKYPFYYRAYINLGISEEEQSRKLMAY